ncbi:hypothetical protein GCM10025771_32470 [Niveibacterium umoris]|uniref:DUF3313 domain-containing protein n=1 Tax=Niveibacterium umoris TaxID=1193620 RepID=A0A840BIW9_9RHOO|nr:hypothetical protein [Niveibacterium umoris]MBB4011558.1 hypothetical protein [Niveibacterium umoris]
MHSRKSSIVAGVIALSVLSACAVLDSRPDSTASAGSWNIVRKSESVEVMVRKGVPEGALKTPGLGTVRVHSSFAGDDVEEVQRIADALTSKLKTELPAAGDGASTLNVTISELSPVSPALNVASALLVFYPLDTGGATIEAELVDSGGTRVAVWRERLSGGLGLTGSLSRWAKVRNAVVAWGEACAHQPPWLMPAKVAAL